MLKKGQRVKINSGGDYCGAYDERTGVTLDDCHFMESVYVVLDIGQVIYNSSGKSNLTPVEPSIDNLMVGDVVDLVGTIKVVTFIGNDNHIVLEGGSILTKEYMNKYGYKVISPKLTMTIEEAEEKLNAIIKYINNK